MFCPSITNRVSDSFKSAACPKRRAAGLGSLPQAVSSKASGRTKAKKHFFIATPPVFVHFHIYAAAYGAMRKNRRAPEGTAVRSGQRGCKHQQ
jgi:hypothetical protein